MYCCANCFAHEWLKSRVNERSTVTGDCDFCEAESVPLLETSELATEFHNLLSMYVASETFEEGESLLWLIQWNWNVFHDDLDEDQQARLLENIVNSDWDDDDGEPQVDATEFYMRKSSQWFHDTHSETRGTSFVQRYVKIRQTPMPFDEFIAEELGESDEALKAGTIFTRARLGFTLNEHQERLAWSGGDIGPPPSDKASAGRTNVQGQVVLYVADDEKTAVSEVRPALGFYVSLAQITLLRDCRVLDLTKDLPSLNPFVRESIGWHVEIRELLRRLGEEMSRPLERNEDKSLYVPCQRFADYIRENRYDGIRYPSALNPGGSSIVFFDPTVAEVGPTTLVKITEVNFEYETDDEPRLADRLRAASNVPE
jgi:hypothetical protein